MSNLLKDKFPEIVKDWDYSKNHINLEQVSYGSKKEYWWKCNNNHSYLMSVNSRTNKKSNCPYCTNKKVLPGFNDLKTLFPDIAKEYLSDNELPPNKILAGSANKVYWKCKNNHIYISKVVSRTLLKRNCPYCSSKNVFPGFNDLQTLFPDIAKEYSNKNELPANQILASSHKKVYWNCPRNHTYLASINNKTNNKTTCSYCSNKKVLSGFNDLQTLFPDIAKEYSSKNKLPANKILAGSNKKVYWKCPKGHEWELSIRHRTKNKSMCPKCSLTGTSKHEQILFNELNHIYQCENRKKHKINDKFYETDIFIPELNLGIEFNGLYWHKNKKEKDKNKETKLSTKIKMIYVMESTENKIIDNKIHFDCKHKYEDNFIWAKEQLKSLIKNINS